MTKHGYNGHVNIEYEGNEYPVEEAMRRALEYLRDTHGMGEIRRLLKLIPSNPDFSSILQDELRLTYPAFEQEVASYVVKRYGS